MSLDGFVTGPDDREGQELGRNGGRLFKWLDVLKERKPGWMHDAGLHLGHPVRARS
jgi:hypothetical protein